MRTVKRVGESVRQPPREPPADAGQAAPPERSSRRSFVFFGALAATALVPKAARAQRITRRRLAPSGQADDARALVPRERVAAFA